MRTQDIARAVRDARVAAGLSINELAHQIHTPASTISRIERGTTQPRRGTLTRLNRVLKIFNLPCSYEVEDAELQEIIDFVTAADEHARGYLLTAVRRLKALERHPNEGIAATVNRVVQSRKEVESPGGSVATVSGGGRGAGRARASRRSAARRAAR